MKRSEHPPWLLYGVALLVTCAALAVKLLLVPWVTQDEPVLIFLAAVLVAASYGGFGPGLLAIGMSATFDLYFFMEPFNRWWLNNPVDVVKLVVFAIEGVFICWICARMKSARSRAEESAAEAYELEGQLLAISEGEQRRVGHDLHDGLGQQLTGIALMARRLQEILAGNGSLGSQEASRLCDLANSSVAWTRDLCRSLSPAVLESRGLGEALRELSDHAAMMFKVQCNLTQRGDIAVIELGPALHLYRIAQEAISNAVKHGSAKNIELDLHCGTQTAFLLVADDGVGIDAGRHGNGMGMKIMRYRAKMIGGTLDVNPREQGGTAVTCLYPLAYTAQGEGAHANH